MLTLIFTIGVIWFVAKLFILGLKASWGIFKLLCSAIFFPLILIGLVVIGLVYVALPILIIAGIAAIIISRV